MRQRTRCSSRRVSARRTPRAASHSASGVAAALRRWWVRTAGPGIQSSRRSSARYGEMRGMRLIQHKKEAYWFYRFLSTGYDRWVNPLFWTPAMRTEALRGARLDERRLEVLDAGAGTGFTTEGIVEAVDADRVTMLDQSPHQLARARAQAGAGAGPQAAGRRRGAAARDRSLRPLRLRGLDRVLAGARARDRRGLPRAQAGRRSRWSPARCRRATASCAGSPSCGCCSRPRRSTATGSSARASRTSS